MSYEERCILLNWNTLQHRREYLSVVECYKTVFGLNGLDFDDYFKDWNSLLNHLFTDEISLDKILKRLKKMDEDLLTQKLIF